MRNSKNNGRNLISITLLFICFMIVPSVNGQWADPKMQSEKIADFKKPSRTDNSERNKIIYGDMTYEEIKETEEIRSRNWNIKWYQRHEVMCSNLGYTPNVCRLDLKKKCGVNENFRVLCLKRGLTNIWPKAPIQKTFDEEEIGRTLVIQK